MAADGSTAVAGRSAGSQEPVTAPTFKIVNASARWTWIDAAILGSGRRRAAIAGSDRVAGRGHGGARPASPISHERRRWILNINRLSIGFIPDPREKARRLVALAGACPFVWNAMFDRQDRLVAEARPADAVSRRSHGNLTCVACGHASRGIRCREPVHLRGKERCRRALR